MRPITISEEQGTLRLDRLLRKRFRDAPLSLLYKVIRLGWVRVNDRKARPDDRLEPGDTVSFSDGMKGFGGFVRDESAVRPEGFKAMALRVLYEDADLLAIDKPPTIISQGISDAREGSLLDQIRAHLRGRSAPGFRPELAHRLDRETSGVVLAAKTPRALSALGALFRGRQVEKSYVALVKGRPAPPSGTLSGVIATWREKGPAGRKRRRFFPEGGGRAGGKDGAGEGAQTETASARYETVQPLGDFSLVRIRPETGRTHQIRLQLQAIGHPVVGDKRYGDPSANGTAAQFMGLERLFLHAERLSLVHPFTGEPVRIESPLPPDLEGPLQSLRRHLKHPG